VEEAARLVEECLAGLDEGGGLSSLHEAWSRRVRDRVTAAGGGAAKEAEPREARV
jgi:hypothetical protein